MPTFRLRRFSSAETLRTMHPHLLLDLLGRHAAYFSNRGIDLNSVREDELDYEAIALILMTPDESTPAALVDDLYFVDEMATVEGMDVLRKEVAGLPAEARARIDEIDGPTPADYAVAVRLHAPEVLESKHAERFVTAKKSFFYFRPKGGAALSYRAPRSSQLRSLENALGLALEEMKRGRSVKVFVFHRDREVWILVRRGDPCKREASVSASGSASVYYRPEVFDVIRYDDRTHELSISAGDSKKIYDLHRQQVGLHFFGSAETFADRKAMFTLDPLWAEGEESIACLDIDGMESVVLKEIRINWGGTEHEVEIRRASNLFRAFKNRNHEMTEGLRIVCAKFDVKFTDARTPRVVTITSSNQTTFTRDSDAPLVEMWMVKRGFTLAAGDAQP